MLPRQYRSRYSLFLALSLLIHLAIVAVMLWAPVLPEKAEKEETTVTVKLKQEQKKQEAKKQEEKKLASQAQQEKSEPKKAEPKKAEPKKSEPKKSEPKKAEPKKSEPKKSEPKKAEPKKAEPKKAEPKKAEPKKAEPKKAEPKKAEPKKAEPKKSEPKKSEPKKSEPKKSEPKKSEPKKSEPKQEQPKDASQAKKSQNERERAVALDHAKQDWVPAAKTSKELEYWTKELGGLKELKTDEYRKAVVFSRGESTFFASKTSRGNAALKSLNPLMKLKYSQSEAEALQHILKFLPKKKFNYDGPPFKGEIRFLVDSKGNITNVNLKTPSPVPEFDEAMARAIVDSSPLPMPDDAKLAEVISSMPKLLWYDQNDLN